MMIKKPLTSISLLLLFAAICALPLVYASQTAKGKSSSSTTRVEHTSDTDENRWNWHHVDDHVDLQVTIRGKVEFAEDYSDVTAISPLGGELRITERRSGTRAV